MEQMKNLLGGDKQHGRDVTRTKPTIGLNVGRLQMDGCKLLIWDLGGQTSLRVIWDKYYPEAHALIFVIDSADKDRLKESHQELKRVLSHQDLEGAPVLIFANKQDLHESMKGEDIAKLLAFDQLSLTARRSFRVQDICALKGRGIEEGVKWLLDACKHSSRALKLNQ